MTNPDRKAQRTPSNQSSVVSKCTRLLDILADAGKPLSFAEIVARSGFVKSSAHRIIAIMLTEGLAEYDDRAKTYWIGPKLMSWAMRAWRSTDLQSVAADELERLREATGHNVELAVRDGERVLYLRTFNSYPVRLAAKAGDHAPLHCTAIGKALTAFLPEHEQAGVVEGIEFRPFTEYSCTDRTSFEEELDQVRKQGYAVCDREEFLQVCGIAAPIFDFEQSVQGAFCVWALTDRAGMDFVRGFVPLVLDTAQRISARLGYQDL